jgi:hypothetical protein
MFFNQILLTFKRHRLYYILLYYLACSTNMYRFCRTCIIDDSLSNYYLSKSVECSNGSSKSASSKSNASYYVIKNYLISCMYIALQCFLYGHNLFTWFDKPSTISNILNCHYWMQTFLLRFIFIVLHQLYFDRHF